MYAQTYPCKLTEKTRSTPCGGAQGAAKTGRASQPHHALFEAVWVPGHVATSFNFFLAPTRAGFWLEQHMLESTHI